MRQKRERKRNTIGRRKDTNREKGGRKKKIRPTKKRRRRDRKVLGIIGFLDFVCRPVF
jgi:hypothetical protein